MKRRIRIAVVVRDNGEPECWPVRSNFMTDEVAFAICGATGTRFIVEVEVPEVPVVEGHAAPVVASRQEASGVTPSPNGAGPGQ